MKLEASARQPPETHQFTRSPACCDLPFPVGGDGILDEAEVRGNRNSTVTETRSAETRRTLIRPGHRRTSSYRLKAPSRGFSFPLSLSFAASARLPFVLHSVRHSRRHVGAALQVATLHALTI